MNSVSVEALENSVRSIIILPFLSKNIILVINHNICFSFKIVSYWISAPESIWLISGFFCSKAIPKYWAPFKIQQQKNELSVISFPYGLALVLTPYMGHLEVTNIWNWSKHKLLLLALTLRLIENKLSTSISAPLAVTIISEIPG